MKPEYIDTHTHTNFALFDEDREEVIDRALAQKTWIINVGTQKDTSKSAVTLAEKYDEGVYAIVGVHPIHTTESFHDEDELGEGNKNFVSRGEVFDSKYYEELAQHSKVVAIGETGLDYFHLNSDTIEKQRESFIVQIQLANKVGKPLMLHIRPSKENLNVYRDALDILKRYAKVRGNAHFFAGSLEDAKGFLDIGYTISFTGVITFTHDYDEIIKYTPLTSLLSETDAPYVAPTPHRGRRNEPVYVQETVKRMAEIKGIELGDIKKQLVENAFDLFKLTS